MSPTRARAARRAVAALSAALLTGCTGAVGASDVGAALPTLRAAEAADLPCGHLFARVSADERALLLVTAVEADAPTPGTAPLDGTTWRAELRLGRDLAANWCDDVIESGEPTPRVDATFPVGGTLTWTADSTECAPATAELRGLVVDLGQDGVVNVGDLTVQNPNFGCFAG